MVKEARENLDVFRRGNPKLFYSIYNVPVRTDACLPLEPELAPCGLCTHFSWQVPQRADGTWFDCLEHVATPYDPLTIIQRFSGSNFSAQLVQGLGIKHSMFIGNSTNHNGVPVPDPVKQEICRVVALALGSYDDSV